MFGFSKKATETKSKFTDAQKSALAGGLAKMLLIQMTCAPVDPIEVTKIEVKKGHINRKAIGYIYGFIDSAIQCYGEDIADVRVGPPILYHVLRALFSGHEREYMEFLMNHEDDQLVMLGKLEGGQQYIDFLPKPGVKRAPMGFARFIVEDRQG
jgi:hypothetical protein